MEYLNLKYTCTIPGLNPSTFLLNSVDETLMTLGLSKCIVIWYWRITPLGSLGAFHDNCKETSSGTSGQLKAVGGSGSVQIKINQLRFSDPQFKLLLILFERYYLFLIQCFTSIP